MGFGAKNDIKSVGHGGNRDEEIVSHCKRSIGQEPSGNTVPAVDLSYFLAAHSLQSKLLS